jgi:hypothetical protein
MQRHAKLPSSFFAVNLINIFVLFDAIICLYLQDAIIGERHKNRHDAILLSWILVSFSVKLS